MKKLFLLFSVLYTFTTISAQQIPNGSFQYWDSRLNPRGWGTWASAVNPQNLATGDTLARLAVKDTVAGDYLTDTATLRLTVDTFTLPSQGKVKLVGFASLGGAFNVAPPAGVGLQFGYMPYTRKPDTLYTDYKFIPAAGYNDTAIISISLTKWDTLSRSRFTVLTHAIAIGAAPQWQRNVAYPLSAFYNPLLPDTLLPDSMQIVIFASVAAVPSLGTTLWIDSLHFDVSVNPVATGVADVIRACAVTIYPNPTDDRLQIAVSEKEMGNRLMIYNTTGQEVYGGMVDSRLMTLSTGSFPAGLYSLRIMDSSGSPVYQRNIAIVR